MLAERALPHQSWGTWLPRSCASSSTPPQLDTLGLQPQGCSSQVLLCCFLLQRWRCWNARLWLLGRLTQAGAVAAVTCRCTQLLSPAGTAGLGPALFRANRARSRPLPTQTCQRGAGRARVLSPARDAVAGRRKGCIPASCL